MDMSKYKDLFISEAREHIQGMNNCILVLEKEPGSDQSINELFRHAHSVKGMSASMGFGKISELSHRLEDMMDTVRRGQTRVSSLITDILLEGTDVLENLVEAVEKGTNLEDINTMSLLGKIRKVMEGEEPEEEPAAGAEPEALPEPAEAPAPEGEPSGEPGTAEEVPRETGLEAGEGELVVSFRIDDESLVPAARAYLAVRKLQSIGRVRRIEPGIEQIKAGDYPGEISLVISGVDAASVSGTLGALSEMGQVNISEPAGAAPAPSPAPAAAPERSATPPAEAVRREPAPAQQAAKTVRISTALLDTFINLVGELIVTKGRLNDLLKGSGSRDLDQVLTRIDHLVGGLHGEIMKVRMMPLETVTQRLPRVVRDLARSRGKKVSLEIIGAQIELDRAILEELGDPLIHILRNAVDHGLEEEKERKTASKDETGRITLRAFRERDMVYVEITDDGRGMDLERIKAKAVEKGLISRDQARVISDEETVMLVCRPGFSTATEVTDVSGRGVGMDVVQSTVESLGGSLSIESATGEGTTFTLRLPLTVAIVKMLLVALDEHVFAIPITRVARTIRISRDEINESQGRRYLSIEEDLVSLLDLATLLRMGHETNGQPMLNVVLVEATNRMVGLVVDSVVGQVDIVVKPLCYPIQYLKRYSGMTVLGDGRIVPILDLGNLF